MKSDTAKDVFFEKKSARNANNSAAGGEEIPAKKIVKLKEEKITKDTEGRRPKGFFTKLFGGIIHLSILMIFFGVPIFFTGFSFQGIAFEKQMYFYFWTLLALVAWVSKGVLDESLKIRRTPLDIPILLFWAVCLASVFSSVDRWHSFWGWFGDPSRGFLSVTAAVIFYYVFFSNFSRKMFAWNLGAFFISGLAASVAAALRFFQPAFLPAAWLEHIPLSLLGSIGGAGILFSVMLFLAITIVLEMRTNEKVNIILKNALTALAIFVVVGELALIWLVQSYINWIPLFLGMGLLVILILSKYIKVSENWSWLPMAVFVTLLIIKLVGPLGVPSMNLPTEFSPSLRVSWEVAKNSAKDNLFLGSGLATYGYDFSLYQPQDFNLSFASNLRFSQGTGAIMESIPAIGILGICSLVILALSFVSVIFYFLKRSRDKSNIYSLGFLAIAILLAVYFLLSQAGGPVILFGLLALILALAIISAESGAEEIFWTLTLKASAKFALTLAFVFIIISAGVVFSFIFIGRAYMADVYAYLGARGIQSGNAGSIEKINKAIRNFEKEGSYYTLAGQEYMLLVNAEGSKKEGDRNQDAILDYVNRAMDNSKKGAALMPNDVQAIEALAQVYENIGLGGADTLKLAAEKYGRASELEPRNPAFFVKLGQIKLVEAGKIKGTSEKDGIGEEMKKIAQEAKDLFRKAIDEKENFAPGFYNLSLADEALGQIDAAIDDAKKAQELDAKNGNYVFNLGRLYQIRGTDDDNKNAEFLFKKILAANIDDINVRFNLGLLYEKTGRKEEAVSEYEKVLKLLPAGSDEVRRKIESAINSARGAVENVDNGINSENVLPESNE